MMRHWKWIAAVLLLCLVGGGAYLTVQAKAKRDSRQITAVYPRAKESFVGDPMPFYDQGKLSIYYLEDLRNGEVGFHPFSLLTTQDFYHYTNAGQVIPYVNQEDSPERALGTGSVIKDQAGRYHAFYTAHNDTLSPKEAIMHATSNDGQKWTKQPKDTFKASADYQANDFRDPYVFYNTSAKEYWMLIATRNAATGVIARYTSKDLKQWQDQGVFFTNDMNNDSTLECPSVVQFKGRWYLAFSDQFDRRVVHYRVADKLTGAFKAPQQSQDYVDGAGFYAGRLVTDNQHLYLVGWIPTKEEHSDRLKYNWAGNLAVHELIPHGDTLVPQVPQAAAKQITNQQAALTDKRTKLPIASAARSVTLTLPASKNKKLILSVGDTNHIVVDQRAGKMAYYNTALTDIARSNPMTETTYQATADGKIKIITEDDIIVVYAGNQAFSNRIYEAKKTPLTMQLQ